LEPFFDAVSSNTKPKLAFLIELVSWRKSNSLSVDEDSDKEVSEKEVKWIAGFS
jgi:hypothetical protein